VEQLPVSLRPYPNSLGDLDSVIKDAGYSLDPSDKADERPPEQNIELTGLGTQFDSNDVSRPDSANSIKDLEAWIRNKRVSYPERRKIFLPIDQLERCMTRNNILQELYRVNVSGDIDTITSALCQRGKRSRQRIFAILCMLGMSAYIHEFLREEIFDTHLPFIFKNDKVYREFEDSHGKQREIQIELFQSVHWRAMLRESFEEYQGQLSAPIFKLSWLANDKVRHFPLKDQLVLPFMYIRDTSKPDELGADIQCEGGTSVVRKVKIHPAHYNAPQNIVSQNMASTKSLLTY
jgi:hypothetical protein